MAFDQVTVSLCGGASWNTYLRLFSGSCSGLTCVTANANGCSVQSVINNQAISSATVHYILLGGESVIDFGSYTITMTLSVRPTPNDVCSSAISLSSGVPYFGSTLGATTDTGITQNCGSTNGFNKGVWFSFSSGIFDRVTISVCGGATWNTYLRLFSLMDFQEEFGSVSIQVDLIE